MSADHQCPICLGELPASDWAEVVGCGHRFCSACIDRWAGRANVCPVDRRVFTSLRRPGPDWTEVETRVARDVASAPDFALQFSEEVAAEAEADLEAVACELCGTALFEQVLLLCDGCNLAFHTYCLSPGLAEVPAVDWYCDDCSRVLFRRTEAQQQQQPSQEGQQQQDQPGEAPQSATS